MCLCKELRLGEESRRLRRQVRKSRIETKTRLDGMLEEHPKAAGSGDFEADKRDW
jgi:hypothetical protein